MGYYSLFKYGTGVLYGPDASFGVLSPIEGPAPGGNDFYITGTGFDPRQWDDQFDDVALDLVKWSDVSSSGTVTTGTYHLGLSTGASAGSTAAIESTATWGSTQGEARVTIAPATSLPASDVDVFVLSLYLDSSNHADLIVRMDPTGALKLYCESYTGGSKTDELKSPVSWTTGLSTFKILRYLGDLYFIANGSVICYIPGFKTAAATFRILSRNLAADYDVNITKVEWFFYRPFVVFQNQPVHDTVVVSDRRVRGRVPASRDTLRQFAAYEGPVDVAVVANTMVSSPNAYRYYYVAGLKSIASTQSGVEVSLINDAQLVTLDGDVKGLGGGY